MFFTIIFPNIKKILTKKQINVFHTWSTAQSSNRSRLANNKFNFFITTSIQKISFCRCDVSIILITLHTPTLNLLSTYIFIIKLCMYSKCVQKWNLKTLKENQLRCNKGVAKKKISICIYPVFWTQLKMCRIKAINEIRSTSINFFVYTIPSILFCQKGVLSNIRAFKAFSSLNLLTFFFHKFSSPVCYFNLVPKWHKHILHAYWYVVYSC